jgi:hypothetical protein
VLDAIADAYPWLAAACGRQYDRYAERDAWR